MHVIDSLKGQICKKRTFTVFKTSGESVLSKKQTQQVNDKL